MNEYINQQYNRIYQESADFRIFVDNMSKYSTNEIIEQYNLQCDIISYFAVLSKRQA